MKRPSTNVVRNVVAASIAVTAFHFTDNAVSIEDYAEPDWINEAVVIVSWPIFSAIGVAAYMLFRGAKYFLANWFLLAYALAGISSLGHFLYGAPDEFTTRGVVSILMGGVAGLTVLTVALWAFKCPREDSNLRPAA